MIAHKPHRIAAIVGPTAAGKTGLAVALHDGGCPVEAIGCDALQLFRGIDAATAKPTNLQRASLPHHVIDSVDLDQRIDAAGYVRMADAAIEKVAVGGKWPLLVGGTGLYYRALVQGLADIPPVDESVRAQLAAQFDAQGAAAMHALLAKHDPAYAAVTPPTNRQRVLRALEVFVATGRSFSHYHEQSARTSPRYETFTVVLQPPRQQLNARIEARAAQMVRPLLAECRRLRADNIGPHHHATQAIGYRMALRMLADDAVDEQELGLQLARAHRRYAKRQRTWFARVSADLRLEAVDPSVDEVVSVVSQHLRKFFEVDNCDGKRDDEGRDR